MTEEIVETTDVVSVPILDPEYTGFIGSVQKEIEAVKAHKDFDRGFEFLKTMVLLDKASTDASAMMLDVMDDMWVPSEHDGEAFDAAVLRVVSLDPETVRRRLKVQREFSKIPLDYKEEFQGQNFKQQIQVANVLEEGFEIEQDIWIELAEAPDEFETGRILRDKVKKVEPRTNFHSMTIDGDGRVFVHSVRGSRELVRLPVEDLDIDIQKGIKKMVNGARVKASRRY